MKHSIFAFLAAAVVTGATFTARNAHALGPVGIEVGAKAGVGTNPASSGPNPLGFGIGARGGVTILGLYGGLSIIDYLGSSESVQGVSFSDHTLLYGIEGGYGLSLSVLTLRAQLGVGNANVTVSGGGVSPSNSSLYLEPGVTGLVSLGMWFVGADLNALVFTGFKDSSGNSSIHSAMTVHGQVGVTF